MSGSTTIPQLMRAMGEAARAAYRLLASAEDEQKNEALLAAANAIRSAAPLILAENAKDMQAAKTKGLDSAMLDRLLLNDARVEAMAAGLESIAELPDPVGEILAGWQRPNGLKIARVSVPLGVIGIIYESRPNVTADAGALCLKSGNACILRGGSESLHSSMAIVACLHEGLRQAGLPESCIQLVPTTNRDAVGELLRMTDLIDVIIPRGGKSLTERVQQESRVPTLLHLDGNCHTYIHESADPVKAIAVTVNAKMRRTGVCGATESLLIDRAIAPSLLPKLATALLEKNCALRGDEEARTLVPAMEKALERDWGTEYLDAVLSVKIVGGVNEAIAHINQYGSHHTDAIIAENNDAAQAFCAEVDSAIVMHNASTQFADGGEFGMGAEIGIATGRLHARGPVGSAQLVTYKYIVVGNGQVRA